MNATQKKYLRERIDEIAQQKTREISKINGVGDAYYMKREVAVQEQARQIAEGEATQKPADSLGQYADKITDFFNFNTKKIKKVEKEIDKKQEEAAKKQSKVLQEAQRVTDEIMLGDETKAVEMLKAFEKFQV